MLRAKLSLITVVVLFATSASALWFIRDMVDQPHKKPQEGTPMGLPADSVSTAPIFIRTDIPRDELWPTLPENPVANDAKSQARGKVLYDIYCLVCHGETGMGDGPVALKGLRPWFPMNSEAVQNRSDQFIFSQIWVGGPLMGPYWYHLEEQEAWDLVNFVRSFAQ